MYTSAPNGVYSYTVHQSGGYGGAATTSGSGGDCTALSSLPNPGSQFCATALVVTNTANALHLCSFSFLSEVHNKLTILLTDPDPSLLQCKCGYSRLVSGHRYVAK